MASSLSTLTVVVYKNDQVLPNASVQLEGPSGRKVQTTNSEGVVTFRDLPPGKYIANAAEGKVALGSATTTLKPASNGVIHIKYAQVATGSLIVHVLMQEKTPPLTRSVDGAYVWIGGPGPEVREVITQGGKVEFSGLQPGDYNIFAIYKFILQYPWRDMYPATGYASKRVHAGKTSRVWILLHVPDPAAIEVCTNEFRTDKEVEAAVKILLAKRSELQHRIKLEEKRLDDLLDRCSQSGTITARYFDGECIYDDAALLQVKHNIVTLRAEFKRIEDRLDHVKFQQYCVPVGRKRRPSACGRRF